MSKKIKIEEPYSKGVIFIWRENEIILHVHDMFFNDFVGNTNTINIGLILSTFKVLFL